jgi:WD40 repeat protein
MIIRSLRSYLMSRRILVAASVVALACAAAFEFPSAHVAAPPNTMRSISPQEIGLLEPASSLVGDNVCSSAISPDGALLATGTLNGAVRIWDIANLRPVAQWRAHKEEVTALAFFSDSQSLLTAGADRRICRWTLDEFTAPREVGRWDLADYVTALAVAPDGRMAAVACGDSLEIRETEGGKPVPGAALCVLGAPFRALAFSTDGRLLAGGGGGDNAVRIWGCAGGHLTLRSTLVRYTDHWVRGLTFSADGSTLVSLDTAGRMVAWDGDGHLLAESSADWPGCPVASVGAGGKLVVTKDVGEWSAHVWKIHENWWR